MWVTDPTTYQGIELLKHVGCTYVTVACQWVKLNMSVGERRDVNLDKDVFMSTGYYSRANPEMVLIGSTGEPTVNAGLVTPEGIDISNEYTILLGKRGSPQSRSASVRQTVFAPLGKQSEKQLVFVSEIETILDRNVLIL